MERTTTALGYTSAVSAAQRLRQLAEPYAIETPAERLLIALDLMDAGIALMRQNFRRAMPDAPESAVDDALHEWLVAPRP